MKKITIFTFIITIFLIMLTACSTRTSDSGYSVKTVGKRIDSNIYILNVTMLGEPKSNKNFGGEGVSR